MPQPRSLAVSGLLSLEVLRFAMVMLNSGASSRAVCLWASVRGGPVARTIAFAAIPARRCGFGCGGSRAADAPELSHPFRPRMALGRSAGVKSRRRSQMVAGTRVAVYGRLRYCVPRLPVDPIGLC